MSADLHTSRSLVPIREATFLSLVTLLFCCHLTNALISEHLLTSARIFKFSIFHLLSVHRLHSVRAGLAIAAPLRTYALMGILQAVTLASSVRRVPFDLLHVM